MTTVLTLLFASAFTYAASLLTGKMLLPFLRLKLNRSEEWFFGFVLGSACLSTMVFALTAAGLAYAGSFLGLGAALIALAIWRRAYRFSSAMLPQVPEAWRIGFLLIYGVFAIVYLAAALVPETSSDALAYHVALPARYLREHHFPANTRNMMTTLSEGVEMLFLFAYPLARQSAGSMVHLLFALVTPWGMISYARRVGRPEAGVAAALLFFAAPVVGKLSTSGYIDVAVACYVFAVFYLLEIWREQRSNGLLVAAGLLAGFCFDAKYTAAVTIPFAIGYVIFHLWRAPKTAWRSILTLGVCAVAMMSPYVIKNAIVTGNPLAPFANRYFPNPVMTVTLEDRYKDVMQHWDHVKLTEVPLEVTLGGGRLQGILGPMFLLSPLALLALRFPVGRRLLLATAVIGFCYFASIATRFLVPVLPLVALALAFALAEWRVALATLALMHVILSWPAAVARYSDPLCWRLRNVTWRYALRREPEVSFLRRQLADYQWGLVLEENVPAREPVFAFNSIQQAYHTHEIIVGWQSEFGNRLRTALLTPVTDELKPSLIRVFQFPEKTLRRIRVLQTGSSSSEEWNVAEVRLFREGAELARSPDWRLKASHNPWEVQLAFDNNPVTRWNSGQPRSPGMWIQVDLGGDRSVDRVLVQSSANQNQADVRLEFESTPGRWEALAEKPFVSHLPAEPALRPAATAYLKLNHVDWLMVDQSDDIAHDIRSRPADWGISLIAFDSRYRLYHLN